MQNIQSADSDSVKKLKIILYVLFLYLLFEYLRPQNYIRVLSVFKPNLVLLFILLVYVFKNKIIKLSNPSSKLFILLIVFCAIHVPFAVNNYYAYECTKMMLLNYFIYLVIVSLIDSNEKIFYAFNLLLVIGSIAGIIGIASGKGCVKNSPYIGDENDFALLMAVMIPISFFMLKNSTTKLLMVIYTTTLAIFVLAVVTSFSRGGFLAMASVLLYCLFRSNKKMIAIFTIAGIALIFYITTVDKSYVTELETITKGTENSTGQTRIYYWKTALNMFYDNPILGVGPGNFNWNTINYAPTRTFHGRSHGGRSVHSAYFQSLSELGIIGTLILFLFIYLPFNRFDLYKKKATSTTSNLAKEISNRYITSGMLIGFLTGAIFISVLYYPTLYIIIAYCVSSENIIRGNVKI